MLSAMRPKGPEHCTAGGGGGVGGGGGGGGLGAGGGAAAGRTPGDCFGVGVRDAHAVSASTMNNAAAKKSGPPIFVTQFEKSRRRRSIFHRTPSGTLRQQCRDP